VTITPLAIPVREERHASRFGTSIAAHGLEIFVGAPGVPASAGRCGTAAVHVLAAPRDTASRPSYRRTLRWTDPARPRLCRLPLPVYSPRGSDPGIPARMPFGATIAAGDFNADGTADVAIQEVTADGGRIDIYAGDAHQRWTKVQSLDQRGMDRNQPGDELGAALAVADIDGDGRDDLLAGAPGNDMGRRRDVGAVFTYLSYPTGTPVFLRPWVRLTQTSPGRHAPGRDEAYDRFGASIVPIGASVSAADGVDLATVRVYIGAPGEDIDRAQRRWVDAGAIFSARIEGGVLMPRAGYHQESQSRFLAPR